MSLILTLFELSGVLAWKYDIRSIRLPETCHWVQCSTGYYKGRIEFWDKCSIERLQLYTAGSHITKKALSIGGLIIFYDRQSLLIIIKCP